MAFDRPIEADRVDDLGLLSSFVRSPLIGPIMWVLGNHLSRDENKENLKGSIVEKSSLEHMSNENLVSYSSKDHVINSVLLSSRKSQGSGLNALTDVPNDGNTIKDMSTYDSTKNTKEIGSQHTWRKTSWSDESGQNLVEYFDSNSLSAQSRTEPSNSNQPIKSAMRNKNHKQNIPKGLSGGFIRYPSGGKYSNGNGKPNTNGYISPQYGWYISTTPPTPDYHANADSRSSSNGKGLQNDQEQSHPISPIQESAPKFHKRMPDYCGGWPTVPL
jgi:hypothetical protein